MTKEEAMNIFSRNVAQKFGNKYELRWETDKKGVICGWCKLADPKNIYAIAEIVAGLKGRVMTISALVTAANEKTEHVEINYHFYFEEINCTVCISLPATSKKVISITPVLKSADWHEREMKELFNIELSGHPNPKKLFLDENTHMTDHTMIPLSEAMKGASTSTLWEKIMKAKCKEAEADE